MRLLQLSYCINKVYVRVHYYASVIYSGFLDKQLKYIYLQIGKYRRQRAGELCNDPIVLLIFVGALF